MCSYVHFFMSRNYVNLWKSEFTKAATDPNNVNTISTSSWISQQLTSDLKAATKGWRLSIMELVIGILK